MRNDGVEVAKKFLEEGKPQDALDWLKKILYSPETDVDEWKIHEAIGAAFHDLANAEGAAQAYLNAAKSDKILRSQRTHFSNYLFALHYLPQVDEKILSDTAKIYGTLYRDTKTFPPKKISHEKIHVAYLAPHFLDSSSARFCESLLTNFDDEKFYVTAWSLSAKEDDFTKKIRRSVDKYFDVSETNFEEIAEKIHGAGADILFDLGGHTDGGTTLQIAAYKPATIQISGIGYFDTTGLAAIDFFLTDNFLIEHSHENFSEKNFLLENAFAFQPNQKMIHAKKNLVRQPNEKIIFGSLNNFMKITDKYLSCVKKILDAVPNSKIIFRDTTPLKSRQKILAERIDSAGISRDQVEIFLGEDNFFDDYSRIDLMLDTFPYTGGMMTALALYMGVPVLNLCGELHHSRLGAEMLRLVGLEELIVFSADEFIKKAVEVSDKKTLTTLREKISIDKLTDSKSFAENFYRRLEIEFA